MATLSLFFGSLALLLTAIGLYGALAYEVIRRTGEIGIRMALGARAISIVWLILHDVSIYMAFGLAAGLAAFLPASRVVTSMIYGMRPTDPRNLVAAVLLLLTVALIAALFPALRAIRLDPAATLRQE